MTKTLQPRYPRRFAALATIVCGLAIAPRAFAQTSLITNGDFTSGTTGWTTDFNSFGTWNGATGMAAHSLSPMLHAGNGYATGGRYQAITTTVGKSYLVTLWLQGWSRSAGTGGVNAWDAYMRQQGSVVIGGTAGTSSVTLGSSLLSTTGTTTVAESNATVTNFMAVGMVTGNSQWYSQATSFTASGTTTRVGVYNVSTTNFNSAVNMDDVGVYAANDWTVDASGTWSTASNWADGTVPNAAGAVAAFSGTATAPRTITLDSAAIVGGLIFRNANAYTLSGAGTLTLSGTFVSGSATNAFSGPVITVNSGSHVISTAVAVSGTLAPLLAIDQATQLTLSGGISGSAGLVKSGFGTAVLSGSNTYTGATNITNGTVLFASRNALYGGGTSSWTAANVVVGAGSTLGLRVGGAGEFGDSDVTTLARNLRTVSSNGLQAGSVIGLDTTNAGGSFTLSGTIADSTGTGGGAVGLAKLGSGTLAFTAANTYTGNTTISAGVLQIGNGGTTGAISTSSAVSIAAGGTLLFNRSDNYGAADTQPVGAVSGAGTVALQSGTLYVSANNSALTGGFTVGGGELQVATNTLMNAAGTLTISGGALVPRLTSRTIANSGTIAGDFTVGAVGNANALTLSGAFDLAGGTRTVTVLTGGGTFSGRLSNGGLTKAGVGVLTLSGSSGYTGPTTVSAGVLAVTGTLGSSPVTVNAGGTLRGTGSVLGGVTVSNASTAALTAGDGSSGTLTLSSLSFSGSATVNVGTLANYTSSAAINVTGSLALGGGPGAVVLALPVAPVTTGTYRIFSSSNTLADASGFSVTGPTIGPRQTASVVASTGAVNYVVAGDVVVWTGAVNGDWNYTSSNWKLASSGSATTFVSGDELRFDDTATGSTTVSVTSGSGVNPIAMTFANATKNYTIQGSTGITSGVITKSGTGVLTITSSNSFPGGTTLSAGTLRVGNDAAVGTGTLALNGGVLSSDSSTARTLANAIAVGGSVTLGDATNSGPLTLSGTMDLGSTSRTLTVSSSVTLAGPLTFSGTAAVGLTKQGAGTLTLSGSSTYTGNTTVSSGALAIASTGAINAGGGAVTVADGASSASLTINGGAVTGSNSVLATQAALYVGGPTGTGAGVATINSGALTTTGGLAGELWIGSNASAAGYGALIINGGTVTTSSWLALGRGSVAGSADTRGLLVMTGGALNVNGNPLAIGAVNLSNSAMSVMAVSGGTTTTAFAIQVGAFLSGNLDVSGAALVQTAATQPVTLKAYESTGTGILNLRGGVLATGFVNQVATTGTGIFNFNGGTLRVLQSSTTFMQGLTQANVFPGGAVINSNGFNVTIAQNLLAASGTGLSTITVSGGTGYLAPPIVNITGGGGSGATALATIDSSGNLTGITVTNPGTGYTSAPSIALTGGGGSGATITGTTMAANTSGGLTKNGTGVLTLSGSNSFSGATRIGAGGLTIASANGLRNSTLDMNAADSGTVSFSQNSTLGGLSGSRNLDMGTRTLSIGNNNASTTYSGGLTNGALTKVGSGTLTLTGSNGYTGSTSITGGGLVVGPDGSINSTSGITLNGGGLRYNSATPLSQAIAFAGSGGTISGTGVIGTALAFGTGAILSPGNSPGTLTATAGATWSPGGTYEWEINSLSGSEGTGWDLLAVTAGGLNLSGLSTSNTFILNLITLTGSNTAGPLDVGYVAGTSYEFLLASFNSLAIPSGFSNAANSDLTGLFTINLSGWQGTQPNLSDMSVKVNSAGTGIALVIVPEPGTVVFAGIGIALASWSLWKRRRAGRGIA